MDPRFERSVRRWLVGYPRRWRLARADEVIGTLAEMAPAGVTRLDVRSGLGLLVNGLVTRRRMLPPLKVRMRYRLGLGGVPWQYRGWLADEIASPVFQWRALAFVVGMQLAFTAWRMWTYGTRPLDVGWWVIWLVLMFVMPRTRAQREAAGRHLVGRPGDPPTPWDVRRDWVLRDRLAARSVLVPAAAAAATAAAVTGTATAVTRSGSLTALATCLALGLVPAVRLALRWRARVTERPAQPARRLVVASRRLVVAVWCWSAFLLLLGANPPTTPDQSGVTLAPLVLGLVLLPLPTLVVGAVAAVRGPADVALVDVLRLGFGAGPLREETLVLGVLPAWLAPVTFPATAPAPAAPAAPTDPATA